jgi:hypothetical protein
MAKKNGKQPPKQSAELRVSASVDDLLAAALQRGDESQESPALRGMALWNKLQSSAKPLPFSPVRVGKGIVQAP